MEAHLNCLVCGKEFETALFVTLWIEEPKNRALVFEDRIGAVECPHCGNADRVKYSLFCTNRDQSFAVWYEPYPDPDIDAQVQGYAAIMGPNSYFATAPRVADWEEFKATIEKFERGELKGEAPSQFNMDALDDIIRQDVQRQQSERVTLGERLRTLFSRRKGG